MCQAGILWLLLGIVAVWPEISISWSPFAVAPYTKAYSV